MPELNPCPTCGRHSLKADTCCPHCGNCTKTGRTAVATLVGLALAAGGCDNSEVIGDQSLYGVVTTDTGDTGDTGED